MSRRIGHRFTPYPKWWREFVPILGNAELRVLAVIIEQTAGWGRERVALSVRQIAMMAGLNKSNVPKALRALMAAEVVSQSDEGRTRTFALRDLGPEAGWARYADRVVQHVQRRTRKADKVYALRVQQRGAKPCKQRSNSRLETVIRDITRDKGGDSPVPQPIKVTV